MGARNSHGNRRGSRFGDSHSPSIAAEKAGPASLLAFPGAMTLGERAGYIASWLLLGTIPIGMPIIALVGSTYAVTTFSLPHGMTAVIAVILYHLPCPHGHVN